MRIPCFKSKRYLSGADWLVHALDDTTRRTTGVGNHSLIILDLEGSFPAEHFERQVKQVVQAIPFFKGRARRDWTLAPFWSCPSRVSPAVSVHVQTAPQKLSLEETWSILQECANRPFAEKREYIAFHILQQGTARSVVAMQFDHRLLDAYGAELFLDLLQRIFIGEVALEKITQRIHLTEPAHLDEWVENFRAGRSVVRMRIQHMEGDILTLPPADSGSRQDHLSIRFTPEETRQFQQQVRQQAGYLMLMPYGLYVASCILQELARALNLSPQDLLASCSVNQRPPTEDEPNIFFNDLSFMFFRLKKDLWEDRSALIGSIREQFFTHSKERSPEQLARALRLMRIVPLRLLSVLIPRWMKICFGSFNFAFLGQSGFSTDTFYGLPLQNLFHMPRIPPQCGAGVYFNLFRDRLNLTVTLHEGLLDREQQDRLKCVAREACLG